MATLYIMFYQVMGVLATLYIRAGTIHRYIQHDNVYLLSAVPLTVNTILTVLFELPNDIFIHL